VKRLISEYDCVIIGVGSSEKSYTTDNPFTFSERKRMISSCFSEEMKRLRIIAIPDINNDEKWVSHVISCVPQFSIVYSNNSWVRKLFRRAKIKVGRTEWHDRKNCMAKRIREKIAQTKSWEKSVPMPVIKIIKKVNGEERIHLL